ncbi:MAG: response regulator transcription factor [Tissierellia bacterium]|nr:response regulator transcription factor [Tissierellia bacterium]
MKKKIMIVDDAEELREVLRLYLENSGFCVLEAGHGREALERLKENKINLMILDIMMPVMDGYELLKKLGKDRKFPVIFLSARGTVEDRIRGLHLGGDDYIPKPFDPGEVVARVLAVLRRGDPENSEIIRGNIRWDCDNRRIYRNDKLLDLRAKEYQLLTLFMKRPGKVFTKQEIYEYLWDDPYLNDDNTIMVHMSNLREKIETNPKKPEIIITIRGLGYMMRKE